MKKLIAVLATTAALAAPASAGATASWSHSFAQPTTASWSVTR